MGGRLERGRWRRRLASVSLAGALAGAVSLSLSLSACGPEKVRYDVVLDSAAGLISGNKVRVAGVEVGRVVDLRFDGGQALLAIEIDADAPVYADAQAYTDPNNTFGEKHLRLISGAEASGPLPPGSTIDAYEPALDVPIVLNQFKPLVEDESESSYAKMIYGIQVWNGLLGLAFGDPAVDAPPNSQFLGAAATGLSAVTARIRSLSAPIRAGIDDAERTLIDAVADRLLERADRRMAALEAEVGERFDRLDERLAALEAKLDTYDPEELAELQGSIDEAVAAAASLRASTDAYEAFDAELVPLLRNLRTITGRVRDIDGQAIRQFMHIEGTKSNWDRTPEEVRGRIKRLGADLPESGSE